MILGQIWQVTSGKIPSGLSDLPCTSADNDFLAGISRYFLQLWLNSFPKPRKIPSQISFPSAARIKSDRHPGATHHPPGMGKISNSISPPTAAYALSAVQGAPSSGSKDDVPGSCSSSTMGVLIILPQRPCRHFDLPFRRRPTCEKSHPTRCNARHLLRP